LAAHRGWSRLVDTAWAVWFLRWLADAPFFTVSAKCNYCAGKPILWSHKKSTLYCKIALNALAPFRAL